MNQRPNHLKSTIVFFYIDGSTSCCNYHSIEHVRFLTSVLTLTRAQKQRHANSKMCTFSYTAKGLYITELWKIMDEIIIAGGNKSILFTCILVGYLLEHVQPDYLKGQVVSGTV